MFLITERIKLTTVDNTAETQEIFSLSFHSNIVIITILLLQSRKRKEMFYMIKNYEVAVS